jgi:hypothetical protein
MASLVARSQAGAASSDAEPEPLASVTFNSDGGEFVGRVVVAKKVESEEEVKSSGILNVASGDSNSADTMLASRIPFAVTRSWFDG